MDEIEKLKEQMATMQKQLEEATAKAATLEETNKKLNIDLTDAREHNTRKGQEFKKLRDLTDKEKADMSQWELNLLKKQEEMEEQQIKFQEEQKTYRETQHKEKLDKLINEHAKGNKELADKIRVNFDTKLGAFKTETDEQLATKVKDALGLVKNESPDLVTAAVNSAGNPDEQGSGNRFSDSQEGKDLAGALGLGFAKPAPKNEDK